MKTAEIQIVEALATFAPEIGAFALALRDELKSTMKPAFELAGFSAQSFNIGYGFTTTSWNCFCAIIVYRKHINISLPSGITLSDPANLLHGTGSRVRHLKVKEPNDIQATPVRKILIEARENALFLVRELKNLPEGVTTVFKNRKTSK